MSNMVALIVVFSCTLIWCSFWLVRKKLKRKVFGTRLLIVKDVTSNIDLFFAVVFLAVGLVESIAFIIDSSFIYLIYLFWPIYLTILSPVYFIKAFSRVEIYEDGVLSRDSMWEWNIADAYSIKEGTKTATFTFKLDRKLFRTRKIVVYTKDKNIIENSIKSIFQLS